MCIYVEFILDQLSETGSFFFTAHLTLSHRTLAYRGPVIEKHWVNQVLTIDRWML